MSSGGKEKGKKEKKSKEKRKRRKKGKKDKKDKANKEADGKEEIKGNVKKDAPNKDGKQRKQRKSVTFSDSYPFDPNYRDECVKDALSCLFEGLEIHIKDLAIYPKVVAHAVSKTVAQMVQMLCYSEVKWMVNWDDIEGRAHDEWVPIPELHLPPIDTWARAVIPLKLSCVPMTFLKPIRSQEGQFQHIRDPNVFFESEEPVPRLMRRASDTSLVKKVKKCNFCTILSRKEGKRRASDSPDAIQKRRQKMVEGVKRRLSAYIRDQAMLNKILRDKGLLERPKSETDLEHKHKSAYFETWY
ncbi:hypothetical protein MARPO_0040s0107 [Marchantia polymorpha]|uniref:Uncharacterized protein n=1 Tax=Marchantia polymorpha TaxID=3197 RepID=A0A2R6X2Y1_MARPO|nr:hypothetical protein MARPO_0040s0107 [Marchantia polymorpha]|eukprot:PTQ40436.1 hypothetical protein MARPO_0040s0107 [Marchantia polymorpha]